MAQRILHGESVAKLNREFEIKKSVLYRWCDRSRKEGAAGFFSGIAAEHADPRLEMTEFFSNDDAVSAFGRYQATVKDTGVRVDTPVAHYFKFRNGKVVRYINIINSGAFVEANHAALV